MRYLLIILFFFSSLSQAQDPGDKLLKIQKKFISIKSLQADFISKSSSSLQKGSFVFEGKFYYKPEKKIRIESENFEMISDGVSIWNYNKKSNRMIIQSIEYDPAISNFLKYLTVYPENCDVQLWKEGISIINIELVPQNKAEFKLLKIGADDKFIINYLEITDLSGNSIAIELKNISLDANIDDSLFELNPPEGVKIIDLR